MSSSILSPLPGSNLEQKYGEADMASISWSASTTPARSIVAVMSVNTMCVVGMSFHFLCGFFRSVMRYRS